MIVFYLLIIGAAAGFIATRVMDIETNVPVTIAIGVLGAIIGGLVVRALLAVLGLAAGFIGAVLGALLLIWLYQTYIAKKR
ncbi:MAG: GlsB/YeaQ/YmgE family stress response membrane protein [Rhodobacterales bacterium]|jgi:uncharacterized membrane protein YeaQ/YmgE (transglycosylase-associated protein family)|nr:GlsB/YeaQ/YmgE family stress response membrane protein [Pseudomonadota bacterium]MDA1287573.1 GlsB/YeaQ/YmgE family stress response membrane protein [Pseudomonadota bacterium]NQW14044.1 GlsB/YeaQ/YmgE family stress response membrane protein [Rhodobacter sp.]